MVKSSQSTEDLPPTLVPILLSKVNSLTYQSYFNLHRILTKYLDIKSPRIQTKKSFSIISICLILQYQLDESTDNHPSEVLRRLLKQILKSTVSDTQHTFFYQQIQDLKNSLLAIVQANKSESMKKPVVVLSLQLLKILPNLPFELAQKTISKLLSDEIHTSVFSFITNQSVPVLPLLKFSVFTLVLDLDKTLGYCSDKIFKPRPGAVEFIETLSKKFELVLFTSAVEVAANYAMSLIDIKNLVLLRLYRQHMVVIDGKPVKDLRVLGRDLRKIVVLDSKRKFFENQMMNVIRVEQWDGDERDLELRRIGEYLMRVEIRADTCAFDVAKNV